MSSLWPTARARHARLVRRAAGGDAHAFTTVYRELHPLVMAYVSRRVRTVADAEDLVARTFGRVVEHLSRYDPERGSVRAWALAIARNQVIDHLRARRPTASTDLVEGILADAALAPDERLAAREDLAIVREGLAALPARTREMFSLRYGDGLRISEIARLFDMTEDAVKQRFSRALRRLHELTASSASERKEAPRYAL